MKLETKIILGLFGLLLLVIVFLVWRVNHWKAETEKARIEASNAEAIHDTTRVEVVTVDSSQVKVYRRMAMQERQRADDLDRALKTERVARLLAVAVIDSLRAFLRPVDTVVVTPEDTRVQSFNLRQVPYTIDATASLPPRGIGSLRVGINLDPIPLNVRLACKPKVEALVIPPSWARVQLDSLSFDPSVCHAAPKSHTFVYSILAGILGFLLGR